MSNFNIVEINQMIDSLEDFFNDDRRVKCVGGMAGSFIFKHVIEAALTFCEFERILVVEGCQDYLGLNSKMLNNFVYYSDIFTDVMVDPLIPYDPFKPRIMNMSPTYYKSLNIHMIENYELIIINDAHLIPNYYIKSITNNFSGKIVIVADPFDVGGEMFTIYPTITDSLNKLSYILAMARSTYNVDTRAIDKKIKCGVNEIRKINKRSIGKIDDKQYITNDEYLADTIRHRQLQVPFRKNQKLLVTSDKINMDVSNIRRGCSLTNNSMCVIDNANSRPLMKLRIYSSKIIYAGDVSYLDNPPEHLIRVKPANILLLDESVHHRYNHSVLILNSEPITQRQKYSILKNSNNVTVSHI